MTQTDWHEDWFNSSLNKLTMGAVDPISDPLPVPSTHCIHYNASLNVSTELSVATVKLNGGLGSSMGCDGPKSLIQIQPDGTTFLDKIIESHESSPYSKALVLLNSFNTEEQTRQHLSQHYPSLNWLNATQHAFKKIDATTLKPLASAGLDAYNPPGHGSVYFDLYYSGILKQLKDTGIDYLFISNADNLAATVDPNIVQHLAQSKCPFLIELTPKTNNDRKGGTVVIHNNQLTLWEVAQVQSEQQSLFESQPYFNTNNLWVSVSALINVIEQNTLTLDLIKNPKNHHDQSVIQMEYAMGSAIQSFKEAQVMVVPRTRFFPVKRTSDLLLLLSDCCQWGSDGQLTWDPAVLPEVTLSSDLSTVAGFFDCFKTIPAIAGVHSLNLSGPILFNTPIQFEQGASIVLSASSPTAISELL